MATTCGSGSPTAVTHVSIDSSTGRVTMDRTVAVGYIENVCVKCSNSQ